MHQSYRLISLLPSATEIIEVLGMTAYLVGRSHECDFPESVKDLPVCTAPKFCPDGTSQEIHDRVTAVLESALSVYRVDLDLLRELRPTHIITQSQCEVCAVSLADVEGAITSLMQQDPSLSPQLISLQPNFLAEVWQDIERVARALGLDPQPILQDLHQRLSACQMAVAGYPQPRVACIEWIEPLMTAGNWIPELVTLAGGIPVLAEAGKHSPWISWIDLMAAAPDILVFMPCGFDLGKTAAEVAYSFAVHPQWQELPAVRSGRVYITDGNAYFNRPGPRLVDSLEILTEIIHGDRLPHHHSSAWQSLCLDQSNVFAYTTSP
ncbi:MAG: cobalamin-binding protein [Oscillatoriales cyanobacterium SM2_2_1]|nr:cobalamin-binding protein [Oscillatoriales cyanobacterium SM2_2_1]